MKRKNFFVITSVVSVLMLAVAGFFASASSSFLNGGPSRAKENTPYNLILDVGNKPSIDEQTHTGYLPIFGENITYINVTAQENAHVKFLNGGGSIFKPSSKGLATITASFSGGQLKVQTGYSSDNLEFEYTLTSDSQMAIKGNSFKIISTSEVAITSIHATYDCNIPTPATTVGLNSLKLVYNQTNDNAGKSIANELNQAFVTKFGTKLEVVSSTTPVTEKAINLGFNNSIGTDTYQVTVNESSFDLVANDKYGEYEAARFLLNNIDRNDVFNSFETTTKGYETSDSEFKIMSYNVRCADDGTLADGSNGNISHRMPRVAKNILEKLPDSVGVQEATDTWVSGLKNSLKPTYNYVGLGRESNRTGEASGIFYNTNTVKLIESDTFWFSDTPTVPGSHFPDYSGYNRIYTYAIFQRISDGKFYMHVNSHYDGGALGVKDAKCQKAFTDLHIEEMPIFSSADFNSDKKETDGAVYWLLQNGYKNSIDDIKNPKDDYTCPADGYYAEPFELWIDYILGCNKGILFDDYEVMNYKVQAGEDPAPAPTSDHSPIFSTGHFVEPLIPFANPYALPTDSVAINNGYQTFDGEMNYKSSISKFANRASIRAIDSNTVSHSGTVRHDLLHNVDYVGDLNGAGNHAYYSFTSDAETTGDLVLMIAPNNPSNNLNNDMDLTSTMNGSLNGVPLSFNSTILKCHDAKEYCEWTQFVLRDVKIAKGVNNLRLNGKLPNQLSLDVFADSNVAPVTEHHYSPDWEASLEGHFHRCIDEGFEYLTTPPEKHVFDSTTGLCTICGGKPLGDIDLTANAVTLEEYDNKLTYVVNIIPNYDLSYIDISKLFVTGDSTQGNLPCLHVEQLDEYHAKFYFDLSGLLPTATSDSVYLAPHLYYNGLPFDGINGDIRNHYKDTNWDTRYYTDAQYNSSPNHNTVPMYMQEEGHDLTVGKVRARIIYKWSMFMLSMSWTEGTVDPTVKSTTSKAAFFDMYVYNCAGSGAWNRWSNDASAPLLYIYFEYTGLVRPETLTLDNGLTLAGFCNYSGTVFLVFDCSNLSVSTPQTVHYYYMHLFKNGVAYNYAGSSNGDVKTNGSKSKTADPKSHCTGKSGSILSAATNVRYYELYEAWSMLLIGAKNNAQ